MKVGPTVWNYSFLDLVLQKKSYLIITTYLMLVTKKKGDKIRRYRFAMQMPHLKTAR